MNQIYGYRSFYWSSLKQKKSLPIFLIIQCDQIICPIIMKSQQKQIIKIILGVIVGTIVLCTVLIASNSTTNEQQVRIFDQFQILNREDERLLTVKSSIQSIVSKYCENAIEDISDSDRQRNIDYKNAVSSYMTANSTNYVLGMVKSDWAAAINQLQINGIGTFIFMSPFMIGLLLLLIAAPCLASCCLCQQCCPPKCCRGKNPNYQRQELTWPTTFLLLSTLLLLGTVVPSMTNNKTFFADFNCQTSKFFDNFKNGGQTQNKLHSFSGISAIQNQLTTVLRPKISDLRTQVARLRPTSGTVMEKSIADISNIISNIKLMPNGVDNFEFSQVYNYPLDESASTATFSSLLGPKIGQFDQYSTLLGNLYQYLSTIETKITAISLASSVQSQLTDSTSNDFGNNIGKADSILTTVKGNLEEIQSDLETVINLTDEFDSYIQQYSLVLYCSILGCTIAVFLAVVFIKCLSILCCRHLLYFVCIMMFFVCAALFVYAIVLSFLMASMHYTTTYIEETFTSPTKFAQTITDVYGLKYSQFSTTFSECFGGTNDFIVSINPFLQQDIKKLSISVIDSHLFDFPLTLSTLSQKLQLIEAAINEVGLGSQPDFNTHSSTGVIQMNTFKKIASKSLFSTLCLSSLLPRLYEDVWVPGISNTYQSYVSCENKITMDNKTCNSNIADTAACPLSSCLDTFSIVGAYYRASGNINSLIVHSNTRYGVCLKFTTYLNNFHNNYVKKIIDNIGNSIDDANNPAKLAGRFVLKAKNPINSYTGYINASLRQLFTEVYQNFTEISNLKSIFDPVDGVFEGLNCQLLGESGVNIMQALSITAYNLVYFRIITVGLLAFSVFLLMCSIVCFNVRHYQFSKQDGGNNKKVYPLHDESSVERFQ